MHPVWPPCRSAGPTPHLHHPPLWACTNQQHPVPAAYQRTHGNPLLRVQSLLDDTDSMFSKLIDKGGKQAAALLRQMAAEHFAAKGH